MKAGCLCHIDEPQKKEYYFLTGTTNYGTPVPLVMRKLLIGAVFCFKCLRVVGYPDSKEDISNYGWVSVNTAYDALLGWERDYAKLHETR